VGRLPARQTPSCAAARPLRPSCSPWSGSPDSLGSRKSRIRAGPRIESLLDRTEAIPEARLPW